MYKISHIHVMSGYVGTLYLKIKTLTSSIEVCDFGQSDRWKNSYKVLRQVGTVHNQIDR